MKSAAFGFERPVDLQAALGLAGKPMAGGQSLGPMLNLRLAQPERVVDLAGLSELREACIQDGALVLGACITHADIEDGRVPDVTRGAMRGVAAHIAYRAVRTRGTIGGSLSHADPAADWVSALPALGATVTLRRAGGSRALPVEAFVVGALETALESGEIVVSVRVPPLRPGARWGYAKACRKPGEFAHAIAAVRLDPDGGGRVVMGAVEARPLVWEIDAARDPQRAEAALVAAGLSDPVDRHIRLTILRRALAQAGA